MRVLAALGILLVLLAGAAAGAAVAYTEGARTPALRAAKPQLALASAPARQAAPRSWPGAHALRRRCALRRRTCALTGGAALAQVVLASYAISRSALRSPQTS
jgi:hypothetical protein